MDEGPKGDITTLRGRNIILVTKHVNEVKEVLKCVPLRNSSELKYVGRSSVLLVYEKVVVTIDHTASN